MDQASPAAARDPLILTGAGRALSRDCDPTPFLKTPKNRKFMGVQDVLAVVAAGEALKSAGLLGRPLGERAGLFLAVGYIPFEAEDLEKLLEASVEQGELSLRRFSTDGLAAVNPLLTFRCLSNMPAFHISVNFDVQGPYFVTYPGPGQFYNALEQARIALESGEVDIALAAASAHQKNFLVTHHFSRVPHPVPAESLEDAAGCLVLEKAGNAEARGAKIRGKLIDCSISYAPHDPFEDPPVPAERFEGASLVANAFPDRDRDARPPASTASVDGIHLGPTSLAVALSKAGPGTVRHRLESRDGFHAESVWEMVTP
ncbi:MAG: hypothetical protein HY748_11570 [Elusimicrobia bacterium]|nr:hypothetical protein [Elusimicrobiota bacterium]